MNRFTVKIPFCVTSENHQGEHRHAVEFDITGETITETQVDQIVRNAFQCANLSTLTTAAQEVGATIEWPQ